MWESMYVGTFYTEQINRFWWWVNNLRHVFPNFYVSYYVDTTCAPLYVQLQTSIINNLCINYAVSENIMPC